MTWIQAPIYLIGKRVHLIPLEETHLPELISLSKDQRIWRHYPINGLDTSTLSTSLLDALADRDKGFQYPFVIIEPEKNKIIGSTRFIDIQQRHRKLEIGWTWLHPDYWSTTINTECKLLLLTYCFESLSTIRIQLKTDELNIRSRKAIEKTGATFEGIFRHDMIRHNGTFRNSAYYSIIDTEWPAVKRKLGAMLGSS